MKVKRKIIQIVEELCDGCGNCTPACPEQAIQIVETKDGIKAQLVKEFYCDGLGACLGSCPTGALTIEEKESEAYNEEATVERIKEVAPEMLETHLMHMKEHAGALHDRQVNAVKKINLNKTVYELTEEYPELINILNTLGFAPVKNSALRNSVGRMITIPQACERHNKDVNEVIGKLKDEGFEILLTKGEEPEINKHTP